MLINYLFSDILNPVSLCTRIRNMMKKNPVCIFARIRRPELRFRRPDMFLMPTHRERSIGHDFLCATSKYGALKPFRVLK